MKGVGAMVTVAKRDSGQGNGGTRRLMPSWWATAGVATRADLDITGGTEVCPLTLDRETMSLTIQHRDVFTNSLLVIM